MTPSVLAGPQRFSHCEFSAEALVSAKKAMTVSVCLPARDEATTIGRIIAAIKEDLTGKVPLVDEILVVDDRSADATAAVADAAGATVMPVVVPAGWQPGKGTAMATALAESHGDLVVFLDADIQSFSSHFVVGVLGPLLCDRSIDFVKATYQRPLAGMPGEGGRVTELVAKPLLSLLHPDLASFGQPLAGEIAARRSVFDGLSLPHDYGVDVAVLIDVTRRIGLGVMAEVDLGERRHRNRPLSELGPQARSVSRAILARSGVNIAMPGIGDATVLSTGTPDDPSGPAGGHAGTDGRKLVEREEPCQEPDRLS